VTRVPPYVRCLRRIGGYWKGMISAHPSYQKVRKSVGDPKSWLKPSPRGERNINLSKRGSLGLKTMWSGFLSPSVFCLAEDLFSWNFHLVWNFLSCGNFGCSLIEPFLERFMFLPPPFAPGRRARPTGRAVSKERLALILSPPSCARQGVPHGQTESGGIVRRHMLEPVRPESLLPYVTPDKGVVLTDLQSLLDCQ
jgi:hypothetical protein